jgi:hypothetical protein
LLILAKFVGNQSIAIGKSQVGETTRQFFLKELLKMFVRNDHSILLKLCDVFTVKSVRSLSITIGKSQVGETTRQFFLKKLLKMFVRNDHSRFLNVC